MTRRRQATRAATRHQRALALGLPPGALMSFTAVDRTEADRVSEGITVDVEFAGTKAGQQHPLFMLPTVAYDLLADFVEGKSGGWLCDVGAQGATLREFFANRRNSGGSSVEDLSLEGRIAHQGNEGANLHLRNRRLVGAMAGNPSPLPHCTFTVTIVIPVVKCGRKAPGYPLVSHRVLSTTTCTTATNTSPSTHGQGKPLVKGTRKGRGNPAVEPGRHRLLHCHVLGTHRLLHLCCAGLCEELPVCCLGGTGPKNLEEI